MGKKTMKNFLLFILLSVFSFALTPVYYHCNQDDKYEVVTVVDIPIYTNYSASCVLNGPIYQSVASSGLFVGDEKLSDTLTFFQYRTITKSYYCLGYQNGGTDLYKYSATVTTKECKTCVEPDTNLTIPDSKVLKFTWQQDDVNASALEAACFNDFNGTVDSWLTKCKTSYACLVTPQDQNDTNQTNPDSNCSQYGCIPTQSDGLCQPGYTLDTHVNDLMCYPDVDNDGIPDYYDEDLPSQEQNQTQCPDYKFYYEGYEYRLSFTFTNYEDAVHDCQNRINSMGGGNGAMYFDQYGCPLHCYYNLDTNNTTPPSTDTNDSNNSSSDSNGTNIDWGDDNNTTDNNNNGTDTNGTQSGTDTNGSGSSTDSNGTGNYPVADLNGSNTIGFGYTDKEVDTALTSLETGSKKAINDFLSDYTGELTNLYSVSIPVPPSCGCVDPVIDFTILSHHFHKTVTLCTYLDQIFFILRPLLWFVFLVVLTYNFLKD